MSERSAHTLRPRVPNAASQQAMSPRTERLQRAKTTPHGTRPRDTLVHLLLESQQLAKLLMLVRQRRVSVGQFDAALRAGRRPDVLRALSAPLAQLQTTVAHELIRLGTPAHVQWVIKEVPELLHAREPGSKMTLLHAMAMSRDDNDAPKLIDILWRRVDAKLLAAQDAAKFTAAHYLAMRNARHALAAVSARLGGGETTARNGETPASLALTQMQRALDSAERENARLRHNTEAAERAAEDLRVMHAELDRAIRQRDTDIERRQAEIGRMRKRVDKAIGECDALRAAHDELERRGAEQASALERAESETREMRQRAAAAERHVAELRASIVDGDQEAEELAAELDELRARLVAKERELDAASEADEARVEELERERDALLARQSAVESNIETNDDERADLRTQLGAARREHADVSGALVESRSRLAEAELDAEQLRERSTALQAQCDERGAQLDALARERDALRAEAQRATEQARRATEAAARHADALRAMRASGDADAAAAAATEDAIDAAERELAAAREREVELRTDSERREAEARDAIGDMERRLDARQAQVEALTKQLRDSLERADRDARARSAAEQLAAAAGPPSPAAVRSRSNSRAPQPTATARTPRTHSADTSESAADTQRAEAAKQAERAVAEIVRRNAELNTAFFDALFVGARTGDVALVERYLALGVSPNTRNAAEATESGGQTLLEIAVLAARDATNSAKMVGEKEAKLLVESLARTVRALIEAGGDWAQLDAYLDAHADALPGKVARLLRSRDDFSPFCQALLANKEERAERFAHMVEDFNRVPAKHASDRLSYLHLAAAGGHARLVQLMALSGRCDPNLRDAKDRAPLHIALQKIGDVHKRLLVVEYLLAAGAHPTLPSTYQKLNERARRATTKFAAGSPLARAASAKSMDAEVAQRVSAAQRFGTPLALAEAASDASLVAMMRNRRYLRLTTDKRAAEDYGAPLLQEYVANWVTLHVEMEQLVDAGVVTDASSLHQIFKRYGSVFACFNDNFGGRAGYAIAIERIYAEAGIDRYAVDDEQAAEALGVMVRNDEAVIAQQMNAANDKTGAAHANASTLWNVCKLLMQCTKAVTGRWFEVDRMIEEPARALYPRAARIALAQFVRDNRVAQIDWMLNRNDALFGDLSANSTVDERLRLTPIELAAHCGVADALEYFLERQRSRIDAANADGRTLIMIALAAYQPISIVTIDHFKWRARMSAERHPNAQHYGLLTRDMRNSVLHQCARQHRPDLLSFCVGKVEFQLERTNQSGETPTQVARSMIQFQNRGAEIAARFERCAQIIERRLAGESDSDASDDGASGPPSRSATLRRIDIDAVARSAAQAVLEASPRGPTTPRKHKSRRHRRPSSSSSSTSSSRPRKHKSRKQPSARRPSADERSAGGEELSERAEHSEGAERADDFTPPQLLPPPPLPGQ